MAKRVITVFGGTGIQGSSVVRALVAPDRQGKYHVRVATRDIAKDKAKDISSLPNVEMVQASYDNYESLVKALTGAYGCWFVTSFWDKMDPKVEIDGGVNVGKAAKQAGVQHLVFSTLESPKKYGADFDLLPFEDKVAIEVEIKKLGVPYTFVNVAYYFNNFESFAKPAQRGPAGPYYISVPIGTHGVHMINNADVGPVCAHVFDHPEQFIGKKIGISGTLVKSTQEIADAFNEVFAPTKFVAESDFDGFKAATAQMPVLWMMMKHYDISKADGFDFELTRKVNPKAITSVKQYLLENKSKFKF